jgi:putative membrane protein
VCGVAELRLESAGGGKAEAEMRVLSVADAQALELLIRQRGAAASVEAMPGALNAAPAAALLSMNTPEVIRLGLISNRGMVLVAAAFGAMWQFMPEPWVSDRGFRQAYGFFTSEAATLVPGWLLRPAGAAIVALVFFAGIVIAVRVLSVVLALLQFHGFRLEEIGRQLRVERGLLTRVRTHVPRRRIQAWRLYETVLHRCFRRQGLRVDSAAGDPGQEQQGVRDLAPLAAPKAMETLIRRVLRSDDWPPHDWRPLHRSAWRRLFVVPSTVVMLISAALTWQFGPGGTLMLAVVPVLVLRARLWARHAGYAEGPRLIAIRTGWLTRSWQFAEIRKLQSLWITASPIDRRHGMATLWLDTAGASTRDGTLRIPFMPAPEARALYERLAAGMDG